MKKREKSICCINGKDAPKKGDQMIHHYSMPWSNSERKFCYKEQNILGPIDADLGSACCPNQTKLYMAVRREKAEGMGDDKP
eukprot:9283771-Ditylum_brightwellii.AAC.1